MFFIVGSGLLLIDLGNASSCWHWGPGRRGWPTIMGHFQSSLIEQVMTDYWKAYEHFVPLEKHIPSKAETFIVEGYNSLFRHSLACLLRKTKCYSKSEPMLRYSVLLLRAKLNGELKCLLN
jgi:insertion element IS1 protein InsB